MFNVEDVLIISLNIQKLNISKVNVHGLFMKVKLMLLCHVLLKTKSMVKKLNVLSN